MAGVAVLGFFLLSAGTVSSITRGDLLEHGPQFGDRVLDPGTDQTQEVPLDQTVFFFDGQFNSVYVSI